MRLREIHFNHDRESATSDAFTLGHAPAFVREGESLTVNAPEWTDGTTKPVGYARAIVKDPIRIKALFTDGPPGQRLTIQALAPVEPVLQPSGPVSRTTFLGAVKPQVVAFDDEGNSALQEFEVSSRISDAPVGVADVEWMWQCQQPGGAWHDFTKTSVRTYITILAPGHAFFESAVLTIRHPWAEAVALACGWSAGALTLDDAIVMIANALNSHPKLVYDESGTQFVKGSEFLLTYFLSELANASSVTIDCRGIATAFMTFANLVGANFQPLVIDDGLGGGVMTTKPVKALSAADWVPETWSWHEVAVDPASPVLDNMGAPLPGATIAANFSLGETESSRLIVYDANLHLNQAGPVVFPIRVQLGLAGSGDQQYRDLLLQRGTGRNVTPKAVRTVV